MLMFGQSFAQIHPEEQDVRKTLMNYLNGRNNGDTLMLASAFNANADLRYINKGSFTIWPIKEYIKGITPNKKQDCISRIISINIRNTAAQAIIEIEYPKRLFTDYINLLKINDKWLIVNKIFSSREINTAKRILFVSTSHEDTGKKTGLHLGEIAEAHKILSNNGFEIDFANPKGLKSRVYETDVNNPSILEFIQNQSAFHQFSNPLKLSEIIPQKYSAMYISGGHGAMWDLPAHPQLDSIIRSIYEQNGIVAAVSHGPAALVNVHLSNGELLIKGKKLTAFTNKEEKESGYHTIVPFLLESKLKKEGSIFSSSGSWQKYIIRDGQLITGQNPASTIALAEEIVKAINLK